MLIPFISLFASFLALRVLHLSFALNVRSKRPDLLIALRLDDQPAWVRWARWNGWLLPYWSFILRRTFEAEFVKDPSLRRSAEVIYWVQLVQIVSAAALLLEFTISLGGTVVNMHS